MGDANVKPESETEFETGFDATMFHSRAQFTFTVYQKRVTNLLLEAAVNASRGYDAQWLNGGEFTNQGAEISLATTPVQLRNGFTWVSTTSFYRNYSVVNALPSCRRFQRDLRRPLDHGGRERRLHRSERNSAADRRRVSPHSSGL